MSTEVVQVDHLDYVRQRLRDMPKADRPRLAVDVGISQRTLYNIMEGKRDAKYSNVMKLHKAFKDLDSTAKESATGAK